MSEDTQGAVSRRTSARCLWRRLSSALLRPFQLPSSSSSRSRRGSSSRWSESGASDRGESSSAPSAAPGHRPSGRGARLWRRVTDSLAAPVRRRQTWAPGTALDEATQERLRAFYQRNLEASRRASEEMERRESVVAVLAEMERAEGSPPPQPRAEETLSDFEEEAVPSSETGGLPQKQPTWSEGAAYVTAFAQRAGSVPEELIRQYDVFEPDMRSTRWSEYCVLLRRDRDQFDQFLREAPAARRRARRRAETVSIGPLPQPPASSVGRQSSSDTRSTSAALNNRS